MKKLTKIKLINWHYLVDATLQIKGSSLITGDNGAGKSTILDALQFVLTAGKQKFNTAANEHANRDLIGYVRCKTGQDSNQYERTGDVTCHIALEFYDETKKKYFVVGVVIDSASNLSKPKSQFYSLEQIKMTDELFIKDTTPRNINDFKAFTKDLSPKLYRTQTEARNNFKTIFGSLNDRFFDILPKALAFRPINDIKDFVYSFLLDAKEVNIDFLKENIRTLRDFEKLLNKVKEQMTKLDAIEQVHKELLAIEETIQIQNYIVKRVTLDLNHEEKKEKQKHKNQLEQRSKIDHSKFEEKSRELRDERAYKEEIERSLLNNENYQMIKKYEEAIASSKSQITRLKMKAEQFHEKLNLVFDHTRALHEEGIQIDHMEAFYKLKSVEINEDTIDQFIQVLSDYEGAIGDTKTRVSDKKSDLNYHRKHTLEKLTTIKKDIEILNSQKLIYPPHVTNLIEAIRKDIKNEIGKDVEPKILCELLNIKDPKWQDAIEGYLNTQRFNLIVEPEYFDLSLQIYERVKTRLKIHTTGLVNTQKLDSYASSRDTSLAFMVTSQNEYALKYANMILDRVERCLDVDDLKRYPVSITPSCMVYQNNTARQIKEEVYQTPYIGEHAYKRQLELKIVERDDLERQYQALSEEYHLIEQLNNRLNQMEFGYLKENFHSLLDLHSEERKLVSYVEKITEIDQSSYMDLELKIESLKKSIIDLEKEKDIINRRIGEHKISSEHIEYDLNRLSNIEESLNHEFALVEQAMLPLVTKSIERYNDALKDKHLSAVKENYTRSRQGSESRYNTLLKDLGRLQLDYNRDYHFGAAEGQEGMDAFYAEYKNIKESKVIQYEEKIKASKKKTEEQFQDEFISKLQENIRIAQKEFRKLNDALKGIRFGEDEYKFIYDVDKTNNKLYDMIMDDSNIGEQSLFSGAFKDKHKEALEELFDRITIDDDQASKALEKFTDYRTYMSYDIRITHGNGTTSTFSKVAREKSGGETQTPYYVAIAASFVQLYTSHYMNDSIGLLLFDEVFDKMDEKRIMGMMSFLNKLELQIILAAPPQKVESITPFVASSFYIYRENQVSYIEEFHHETL